MKLGTLVRETRDQEWLIPRFRKYLRNRNVSVEAEHAKAIIDRPERDRSIGWSASSAGSCLRAQLYRRRNAPSTKPDDRSMAIFHEGHYVHMKHQAAGLTAGYLADVEVPVEIPDLNVQGTMDAKDSEGLITEIKSINPYGFSSINQFGPKWEHLRQVNAYMLASGIDKARILYENKATQEMREFLVTMDTALVAANVGDWKELNEHDKEGTKPPMLLECQDQEGKFKWCPFAEECLKDHQAESPRLRIRRTSSSGDD